MKRVPRKRPRKLGVRALARVTTPTVKIVGAGGAADRRVNRYLAQVLAHQF